MYLRPFIYVSYLSHFVFLTWTFLLCYLRLSWKQHLLIFDSLQQIKLGTVSRVTLSFIGVWQQRVKNQMNVSDLPNITALFAQVNGLRGGTSRGRMEVSQVLFNLTSELLGLIFHWHESCISLPLPSLQPVVHGFSVGSLWINKLPVQISLI